LERSDSIGKSTACGGPTLCDSQTKTAIDIAVKKLKQKASKRQTELQPER